MQGGRSMPFESGYSRPKPLLKVEFEISLPENLLHALIQVILAPRYEGFDQWMYSTHAALPADLKADMEIIEIFMEISSAFYREFSELPANDPIRHKFSAFIAKLEAFTDEDFERFLRLGLQVELGYSRGENPTEVTLPSVGDVVGLKTALREIQIDEEDLEKAIFLFRNPTGLRQRFVSGVRGFWTQFYRGEYEESLPLMERSVTYHLQQDYCGDVSTVFVAVTGRPLPKGENFFSSRALQDAEKVVFIPSPHVGPYVFIYAPKDLRSAFLLYNCRPTGILAREKLPLIKNLFPALKALADEARIQILSILRGRELYAQQIVDRMEISQPAVSRHLQLMVAGGVLNVRKEESMKYYSINERTLSELADELEHFYDRSKEE
jgi:DNA-binding transcriptional ArsR family regulator